MDALVVSMRLKYSCQQVSAMPHMYFLITHSLLADFDGSGGCERYEEGDNDCKASCFSIRWKRYQSVDQLCVKKCRQAAILRFNMPHRVSAVTTTRGATKSGCFYSDEDTKGLVKVSKNLTRISKADAATVGHQCEHILLTAILLTMCWCPGTLSSHYDANGAYIDTYKVTTAVAGEANQTYTLSERCKNEYFSKDRGGLTPDQTKAMYFEQFMNRWRAAAWKGVEDLMAKSGVTSCLYYHEMPFTIICGVYKAISCKPKAPGAHRRVCAVERRAKLQFVCPGERKHDQSWESTDHEAKMKRWGYSDACYDSTSSDMPADIRDFDQQYGLCSNVIIERT